MAKKEDRDGREHEISVKSTQETPKILLKTKEKEIVVPATPMQISIAARPSDLGNDQHKYMQSTKTSILPASRDPKDQLNVEHPNLANIPLMKKPLSIINDHYQINSHAFDYLIETNADFLVVGIIGTQGSGKSSILNLLIDDVDGNRCNSKRTNIDDSFSFENDGVFKTRRSKEFIFSNMPATEGIQMYITRDRTILLDCSPVLCNPYKKDGILNELDDLKMLIFLLSVCHLLIVVEDNGFNMNFLRLLQCAENMKIDCSDKNRSGTYSPIILFFKNKCAIRDFLPGTKQRFNQIYIESFKDSKLKINAINYANCDRKMHRDRLNAFHFPLIDTNSEFQCKKKKNKNNPFGFKFIIFCLLFYFK